MKTINTTTRSHSNLFRPRTKRGIIKRCFAAAKLAYKPAVETVLKDVAADLLSHMTGPT